MKYEWEKPDGTKVLIDHPDEIASFVNDLVSRHKKAIEAGSRMEAVALKHHIDHHRHQWRWCMARFFSRAQIGLEERIYQMKLTLAWWKELATPEEKGDGLSEAQRQIFKGVSADLIPNSWAEAAAIIDANPDFQLPSNDIEKEIEYLVGKLSTTRSCLQMAEHLGKKFVGGEIPTQSELEAYGLNISELVGTYDCAGL
jgi:hypothetical protein